MRHQRRFLIRERRLVHAVLAISLPLLEYKLERSEIRAHGLKLGWLDERPELSRDDVQFHLSRSREKPHQLVQSCPARRPPAACDNRKAPREARTPERSTTFWILVQAAPRAAWRLPLACGA